MKQLIYSIFVLTAVIGVFTVTACTDAAEPVLVSKAVEPTPSQTAAAHTDDGQDAPRIALAEAKKAFDDKSATFIDTHVRATYDAGHIAGAINITVQELEAKFDKIPKGKKIIAYCS